MQEWVMALMALKYESEQRKDRSRNVIYEPLDIGMLDTDIMMCCCFSEKLSIHQNYIIFADCVSFNVSILCGHILLLFLFI